MAKKLFKNILLSASLCIIFSSSIHSEDDVCIRHTPCLCKIDEQRFIDISRIVTKDKQYLTVTTDKYSDTPNDKPNTTVSTKLTYYFHPCQDFQFNATQMNLTLNGTNPCEQGASLCMYDSEFRTLTNIGTSKDVKFSSNVPKSLIYTQPNIKSTITLGCTPDIHESYLEPKKHSLKEHQLLLFSSYACIQFNEHGLSTGSTLIILFSVGFGIYLLGGALVLHLLRGARGKEMIPNLDFWIDLPYLVRDGIVFLLNGCNPLSVSSAETYDRI